MKKAVIALMLVAFVPTAEFVVDGGPGFPGPALWGVEWFECVSSPNVFAHCYVPEGWWQ